MFISKSRTSHPEVFYKLGILKNFVKFTGKPLCQSIFFIKKDTLAQVLSFGFFKIFKNTFFYSTPAGNVRTAYAPYKADSQIDSI